MNVDDDKISRLKNAKTLRQFIFISKLLEIEEKLPIRFAINYFRDTLEVSVIDLTTQSENFLMAFNNDDEYYIASAFTKKFPMSLIGYFIDKIWHDTVYLLNNERYIQAYSYIKSLSNV